MSSLTPQPWSANPDVNDSNYPSENTMTFVARRLRCRVLVVDDDPSMRMMLRETMEAGGHEVSEAADGEEALDRFIQCRPDIVLMDVEMPRLDGISACRKLRELPGFGMTPVLMVTGNDDSASIKAAYEAGATDFISKPINWPVLGQRVQFILRAARTLRDLEVSESKNRALLGAIPDSICVLNADGRIEQQLDHGQGEQWLPGDAEGRMVSEYLESEHARDFHAHIRKTLETGSIQTFEFQHGRKTAPRAHEVRLINYRKDRVLALVRNVTERVTAAAKVHRLAFFDALTGLPNRQRFLRALRSALGQAQAEGSQIALLFIDLDFFKRINDNLGHSTGDVLLKSVASRLAGCIRGSDMVSPAEDPEQSQTLARVGGDEFVILARGIQDRHDAERIGIRVHEALRSPFSHLGREFVVTPSIGIALYPQDGGDAEALMKNADTAMYEAKTAGRNTHRFYSESMSLRSMERLDLELKLRKAVEHGDLELYYQPKVDIRGRGIVGVEALLRWNHPEEGFISPERFVPLAEETGLIVPISEWVTSQACEQVRAWTGAGLGDLTIAINVSSQLFGFGNLATMVWGAICNSNIDASSLELEITESLLLGDLNQIHKTLREIQEMGVALAVDDFGTGYSSLSYLKRLNVDALKIDRSFINDITTDADDRAICSAVVAMGHSLGLNVIAEGVETAEQLAAVCQLGCDEVQGFLFGRPVPASRIPEIVRNYRHELIVEAQRTIPDADSQEQRASRRLK